jgi:hypothetical protein
VSELTPSQIALSLPADEADVLTACRRGYFWRPEIGADVASLQQLGLVTARPPVDSKGWIIETTLQGRRVADLLLEAA